MAFSDAQREALLAIKGVGPIVLQRLEEIGIDTFAKLATCRVEEITERVSALLGTTCWKNSPQARAAIEAAIARAKESL